MLKFKRIYIDADRPLDDIKKDLTDAGSHEGAVLIGDDLVYREDCMKVVEDVKSAGYKRIRIQGTGHRLHEAGFAEDLISAGVFQYEIELSSFNADVAQIFNTIRTFEGYGQPGFSPYLAARISVTKNNHAQIGDIVRMVLQCRTDRITLFFDDYDVKMSEVIPYLSMAIETGLLTQVWIQTENLPLCLMAGYEHHVSELYMEDEWERKHVPACSKCVYKESCEGIEVEYIKMHGDAEFKAVLKSGYAKEMVGLRR